nr:hypothetical protein [Tanacetum cinerariifolium]
MPCEALSKEISSSILLLIETTEEGTKILATVDGKLRTVSESSIRRSLKLNDEAGISSLPDAELFENLTLMGYNISPNQKTVPLFPSMLVTMGEGSDTLTEPHYTPTLEATPLPQHELSSSSSSSLPPVTTEPLFTVTPSDTPQLRQYTRRARIAQSLALSTAVDEPASPLGDGSQGEACLTVSGLVAGQDRANITKTSTLPSDSTPRVTSLAADEGNQELEILNLKARVKLLEDREGGATVLSSGVAEVPTGSGSIPTAGLPATGVPTSSDVSDTPKKKKLQEQIDVQVARELEEEMERDAQRINEQIAKDAEITRIHAEEELHMMIDGLDRNNETVAKYLQEYHQFAAELPIGRRIELISDLVKYQDHYAKVLKYQTQQRKPLSRKQQKEFYMSVLKSHAKEAKRFKRKMIRLEQGSSKKLKTSEEVPEEKLKEMMELIPIEEVYVEALQVKLPIIDWEALVKETLNIRPATNDKEKELWVELKRLFEPDVEDLLWTHTQNLMHAPVEWKLYDTCGVHHVISKDQEIFMLVEKDYPLRKGLETHKYATEIIERTHMINCNHSRTPVDTESRLGDDDHPVAYPTLYRSLAGALQYLIFTRPRYFLCSAVDHALQLFSSSTTSLVAYLDADWVGCPTTRRSTSGYYVFLGNNLLSWSSKRQPTLYRSCAEAEYRSVVNDVAETCL